MLDDLVPNEESDAERELAPSVDVPDEADADPRLQRQFWLLVVVFNVAVMAVSVGAMLAVFRAQYDTGTSLVAAGAILAAYGYYKYRVYTSDDAEHGHSETEDDTEADAAEDDAADVDDVENDTDADAAERADG